MEEKLFEGMPYLISYPKGFREDKKYPLIVHLHGAGSRTISNQSLGRDSSVQDLLKRQDERGYVVLVPHCTGGNWYEWMGVLVELVSQYRNAPYIDTNRIHLVGLSMGGYGTWALATLHPDWFASIMPLCGGGIAGFAKNLIHLPIRAFHGLKDKTVDPSESLQMVKAVNLAGGRAELILFPELDHNCWDTVYGDDKNYDWLLSFSREQNEGDTSCTNKKA